MSKVRWIIRRALPALLLLLATLAGLVTLSPRHVPLLEANLENALSTAFAPHRVTAREALLGLRWTPLPHMTLHVRDMALLDADGKPATRLPAVDVELSLARLVLGTLSFTRLDLEGALVAMRTGEDGRLSLGFSEPAAAEAVSTGGAAPTGFDLSRLPVREVRVKNARMIVSSPRGFAAFDLPHFYVRNGARNRQAELELRNGGEVATLRLDATTDKDGDTRLHVEATRLPTAPLVHLIPQLASAQGLTLALTGQAEAMLSSDGKLEQIQASLEGSRGSLENSTLFAKPLVIESFKVGVAGHSGGWEIKEFALQSPDVTIKIAGTLQAETDGLHGDLTAEAEGLAANALSKYWPLTLAPQTREWVTTRIRDGRVPQGRVHFRFTPADLAAPTLPDAAIEADLRLEGATIQYVDHLPPAKDVQADIHITGETLRAQISHATSLSATSTNASTLEIPNFNDLTTPVNLELQLSTTAQDMATLLSPQHLNLAPTLHLDPATIQGTAEGSVALGLIIYPEEAGPVQDASSIVNYRIRADLTGAAQKKLMGRWDVEGLNGHFEADNTQLSLQGTTSLQGVPGTLSVAMQHAPADTTYRWQADMPLGKMGAFGLPLPEGVTGVAGMDATLREREGLDEASVRLDVTQTDLLVPDLGYRKPAGTPGTLELSHVAAKNAPHNLAFLYKYGEETLQGTAQLGEGQRVQAVDLPIMRIAGNDLAAQYALEPDGLRRLQLRGPLLNAAPWMEEPEDPAKATEVAPDPLFNLALEVNVGRVLLGANRALNAWQGSMTCRGDSCQSASLSARTDAGKLLKYNVEQAEGARTLHIRAEDAGEVLRVLKIAEHVREGTLNVHGTFNAQKPGQPLEAKVVMEDFALENAPALTKMLSLLSLTGLRDTVTGKGIAFRKLTGDVTYEKDDLIIRNAKAFGPALGVTLEGEIANQGKQLALTGTLVPSYTANSLLGNIPLLGKALVGGEGEGIFAARFSVKGPASDPEVGVNPLSLLTPGFLRNLFEVAESPSANRVSEKSKKTPVPEKFLDATESPE
jgi:hypothetical protein